MKQRAFPEIFDKAAYFTELDDFYAGYPVDTTVLEAEWRSRRSAEPDASPCRQKALLYETAADIAPIKIFRQSPFYHEISAGRRRNMWGLEGFGAMVQLERQPLVMRDTLSFLSRFQDENLFTWWGCFIDWDHHCLGYDNILHHGLGGLKERAKKRLAGAVDEDGRDFLQAMITGLEAMRRLSARFAARAAEMLTGEEDPDSRLRLELIASTAGRVPWEAPSTFYEALAAILFMREACSSLEGIGISMFGHLDRMLCRYYEADLAAGRITPEEALYLVKAFLAYTDARFDLTVAPETSTTVNIGGQDAEGRPVFNAVTGMICRAYIELQLTNPKLNARVALSSPPEYLDLLAETALNAGNVLAVFNDEAMIAAHHAAGKSLPDSRLYVNGGCQEPMLQNTEVNFKAYVYLNLVKVLEYTLFPETAAQAVMDMAAIDGSAADCGTFEEFYRVFTGNLGSVLDGLSARGAEAGALAEKVNPCPLSSASIDDCIDSAADMLGRGPRYRSASLALNGFGTLADSLYAVKKLVYDEGVVDMSGLLQVLDQDWEGHEELRLQAQRLPKYGHDDPETVAFTARLAGDIARAASGQDNGRGGHFEASLFTYARFRDFGEKSPASPDGRKAGDFFSRGVSPAERNAADLAAVLNANASLPLNMYPGGAILDLTLPAAIKARPDAMAAVIRRFVEGTGSIMQLNVLDRELLRLARANPQDYPHLTVRVYGYSAYFTALSPTIQDEILARAEQAV